MGDKASHGLPIKEPYHRRNTSEIAPFKRPRAAPRVRDVHLVDAAITEVSDYMEFNNDNLEENEVFEEVQLSNGQVTEEAHLTKEVIVTDANEEGLLNAGNLHDVNLSEGYERIPYMDEDRDNLLDVNVTEDNEDILSTNDYDDVDISSLDTTDEDELLEVLPPNQKVPHDAPDVERRFEDEDEDVVFAEDDNFDERRVSDEDMSDVVPPKFNRDVVFNPVFELGMVFESKKIFKKAITSHAIMSKRSIQIIRNDKSRVYAKCKEDGCQWRCNALRVNNEQTFQIRHYNPIHNCSTTFHVSNMKSNWLGERSIAAFHSDPSRDIKSWRNETMMSLNVNISRQQAYRAKQKALKIIEGCPDEQYSKLWDYTAEIRRSNPGSTTVLDIDDEGKFSKLYICYAASKQGFKGGCRPFIGVDGCFLKGPKGGILLAAVGVDPANAIFPLAVAVVPAENKDTWDWFLVLLKHDLGISDHGVGVTLMSDKQKGLVLALKEVFPNAEHRHCVRHLHNNFSVAGFKGEAYKTALWRAARASTIGCFNQKMKEMGDLNEAAASWFEDKDPSEWSKAYFSTKSKCDMVLNNICESFNSAILDARAKPIITMLEWIRQWLMERFQSNRDRANSVWKGKLPPKIQIAMKRNLSKTNDCIPMKSTNRHYQVQCSNGSQYAVDLLMWSCSCREWELSGIPCNHALSAIIHQRLDPELYVDPCYSLETYKKVYEAAILPIAGRVDWGPTVFIPPLPPSFGKRVGRPKKNRNDRTEKEVQKHIVKMKKQHKGRRCRTCGQIGHNKKSCLKKATAVPQNEPPSVHVAENEPPFPSVPENEPSPSIHVPFTSEPPNEPPFTPVPENEPLPSVHVPFNSEPPNEPPTSEVQTVEISSLFIPLIIPQMQQIQPTMSDSHVGTISNPQRGRGRGNVRGRGRGGRGKCSGREVQGGCGRGKNATQSHRLVDEDDTEFEALLSQANNRGLIIGPSTLIPGPTPWEQLKQLGSKKP